MKRAILIALFFVISSSSVFAGQVSLGGWCSLNSGAQGECYVENNLNFPVRCQITASGITSRGFWGNQYYNAVVQPGQNVRVWVRANNPQIDPLVDARVSANCVF